MPSILQQRTTELTIALLFGLAITSIALVAIAVTVA